MKIYCLPEFADQITALRKKNSYRDIDAQVIEHFFGKSTADLCNGSLLNGSNTTPYIKKRLKGSGGYRVYYLLIIKNDNLYLLFIHPKTGAEGSENLKPEKIRALQKDILEAIQTDNLFEVSYEKQDLIFTKKEKAQARL